MSLIRSLRFCIHLIWLSILTGASDVVAGKNHHSIRPGSLERRAFYAIDGLSGRPGNITLPPRLEIRELRKNNAQWNLFLLAMDDFYYNKKQTDKTSYYQVAGIHGRPFVPWDNVAFTAGQTGGYCPHSSTLFPTWHRPYVALYEQIIYDTVQIVAKTFNSSEYTQAAVTFRVPYWDWAAPAPPGQHVLPDTISGSPWIQLNLPTGPRVISNALFRYHFHPLNTDELPDPPFNTWEYSLRYPDSQERNASSQNKLVSEQVDQSQSSYSQRFMNLLEAYPSYTNFSNKAWYPESPGSYDSLESLHDQIHGIVGTNGGHMAYLEYSAFDPLFWLHHTNVDRLLAIWQAIYPNSWIEPSQTTVETATIKSGDTLDGNTPLKPFHKDTAGNFWTSTSARNIGSFGYTYPELQGGTAASVKKAVNNLYGRSAGQTIARRSEIESAESRGEKFGRLGTRAFGGGAYGVQVERSTENTYIEWIANLRVAQEALDSTFYIHVFLGDFAPNPASWSIDPNLVGTHSVFKPFPGTDKKRDRIITGTVPLTKALRRDADAGKVDIKDEKAVEAYLTQNLHWRVTNLGDSDVDRAQVQDLKLSVVSSVVEKAASDSDFPTWGPFKVHQDITEGRPAGLQYGDAV